MGGFANNAPIVTDGLVFYVDAGNSNSYDSVSGGDTWSDLISGNGADLTNMEIDPVNAGYAYDSTAGGGLVFDGTNDVVLLDSASQAIFNQTWSNGFTICSAISVPASPRLASDGMCIFVRSNGGASANNFNWSLQIKGSTSHSEYKKLRFWISSFGSSNLLSNTALTSTSPYYCCVTYDPSASQIKIYINGVLDATRSGVSLNITTGVYGTKIGGAPGAFNGWEYDGTIHMVKAYDKALSSTEVLQNYNALKNRFV
jgi:hypothetical protein